jgi:hypothetical protein
MFMQIDGQKIKFMSKFRPSRRAVNMHARWAYSLHQNPEKSLGSASLTDNAFSDIAWSANSWKEHVEDWLQKLP